MFRQRPRAADKPIKKADWYDYLNDYLLAFGDPKTKKANSTDQAIKAMNYATKHAGLPNWW